MGKLYRWCLFKAALVCTVNVFTGDKTKLDMGNYDHVYTRSLARSLFANLGLS